MTSKPFKLFNLCLLLLATFAASVQAATTINHAGKTLTFEQTPQRVAVFELGTLETLKALGVEATAVPDGYWSPDLAEYADDRYAKVGTLFEPDYEALAGLDLDLIIIGSRSSAAYERLSEIAPTLDLSVRADHFVPDIRRNLNLLGEIFDREERARRLDNELVGALANLYGAGSQAGTGLLLFTINNNVMIHAAGERFGMFYDLTGLESVAPAALPVPSPRPERGSPEAMELQRQQAERVNQALAANPDWLIVLDRGAATGGEGGAAATLSQHPGVIATTAWRKGQVYYLQPTSWYIATGGYLGLMNTLKELQQQL